MLPQPPGDRADPPGDPGREPVPEAGGDAQPGSRWRALIHGLDQRIGTERDGQARAVLRAVVAGPPLEQFLEMVVAYRLRRYPRTLRRVKHVRISDPAVKSRIGEFPVAVVSCEARGALSPVLGAKSRPTRPTRLVRLVRLSAENAVKQVVNHPELVAAHYRMLPDLMEHGKVIASVDGRHITVLHEFRGSVVPGGRRTDRCERALLEDSLQDRTTGHPASGPTLPERGGRHRSMMRTPDRTGWRTVGPPVWTEPATPHIALTPEGVGYGWESVSVSRAPGGTVARRPGGTAPPSSAPAPTPPPRTAGDRRRAVPPTSPDNPTAPSAPQGRGAAGQPFAAFRQAGQTPYN